MTHFANYNATYGSIGGMILLMLWLFLGNVALLVGAEMNPVIEEAMRERTADVPRAQPSGAPAPWSPA